MNSTGNTNQDTEASNSRARVLMSKTERGMRNNNNNSPCRINLMAMLPHNLLCKSGNNDNRCRIDFNAVLPHNLCKSGSNSGRVDVNATLPHNLCKSANNDNSCRIDFNAMLPHNIFKARNDTPSTSRLGQQNPTSRAVTSGPSRDAPLTRNVAPEQIHRRSLWNHGRFSEVSLRTPIPRNEPSPVNQRMDMPGGGFYGWDGLDMRLDVDQMVHFSNELLELLDQYRDMGLDVDSMSYEELLDLEERIGGESQDKINKERKYEEQCCICQDGYGAGDDIRMLDCGHEFHAGCIGQWLRLNNICPLCKMTVIGT